MRSTRRFRITCTSPDGYACHVTRHCVRRADGKIKPRLWTTHKGAATWLREYRDYYPYYLYSDYQIVEE